MLRLKNPSEAAVFLTGHHISQSSVLIVFDVKRSLAHSFKIAGNMPAICSSHLQYYNNSYFYQSTKKRIVYYSNLTTAFLTVCGSFIHREGLWISLGVKIIKYPSFAVR